MPVGEQTADALMEKLIPRVESLKIGPSTDPDADFGPVVTGEAVARIKDYVQSGVDEGASLKVDGRDSKCRDMKMAFMSAVACSMMSRRI